MSELKAARVHHAARRCGCCWPVAAHAQQTAAPVVGWLNSGVSGGREHLVTAFRRGMSETGFVDGQNVAIEYRWADGQYDRLPALAADLTRRGVAVIAATGGTVSSLAAKRATTTIPVVGVFDGDPVTAGLVVSLNRPGGNITGISLVASVIEAKQLELLRELTPTATVIALLANPTNPNADTISRDLVMAARHIGLQLHVLNATTERELDSVFENLVELRASALMVATDPFFLGRRDQLTVLAARHGDSGDLWPTRVHRPRRSDELRHQSCRRLSSNRRLCWQNPFGRQAW